MLAPDLRGHGRSGWEEPWTLEAHVADVLETLSERAAWIGHSFGGRLVLELAVARPDLVERAVLLDPALYVPPDYAALLAEEELAANGFASPEEARELTAAALFSTPDEILAEEVREHLELGADGRWRWRYSREAVAAGYLEVGKPPPPVASLTVPTLVVAGTSSKFVSVGEGELFRRALGERFDLVVVPGGHSVLWDAFAETADAVERFLAAT